MAYGIMPYLVSWDRLKSLYGSQDQNLCHEILQKQQHKMAELKSLFDDKSEDPADYVLDIIQGTVGHQNRALYGYAFEMICDAIGRLLNNSEWYPTAYWYEISGVLTDNIPFSLPWPDDFPVYRVISPENMQRVASDFEKITVISEEAKAQFLLWLKRGKETNRALVLFYY